MKKRKKNLVEEKYLVSKKTELQIKRVPVKFEKKKQSVTLEDLMSAVCANEKFLTLEEVAKMYKMSYAAVRKWAYRGHVPLLVLPSRFYIPLSDLKRYKGK